MTLSDIEELWGVQLERILGQKVKIHGGDGWTKEGYFAGLLPGEHGGWEAVIRHGENSPLLRTYHPSCVRPL